MQLTDGRPMLLAGFLLLADMPLAVQREALEQAIAEPERIEAALQTLGMMRKMRRPAYEALSDEPAAADVTVCGGWLP